jgi:hypothetical protein
MTGNQVRLSNLNEKKTSYKVELGYKNSVPQGRVPQGGVHAPHVSHALRMGVLLGKRFPTSPFWGNSGRCKGVRFPSVRGVFPQKGCFWTHNILLYLFHL